MRTITQEERAKLTKRQFHHRKSDLIERCSKLVVNGDPLFIEQKEWEGYGYAKTTKPIILISCAALQKRTKHPSKVSGMKFRTRNYNEGWLIERIK